MKARLRLPTFLKLGIVFFLAPLATTAQRTPPAEVVLENFDIRTDRAAASGALMERFGARPTSPGVAVLSRQRSEGLARLQTDFQVDVIDNAELGTTEVVSVKPGVRFLTGPATDRVAALRSFLAAYTGVYGLSADQVRDLVLVSDYANPAGNMAWVELEQRINSIPVFQGLIRGGFTSRGELARTTGPLAYGVNATSISTTPRLSAAQAVSAAAQSVGWNVTADSLVQKFTDGERITFDRGAMAADAKARLVYFPLAAGVARLAWVAEIWGNPDVFLIVLDAEEGAILFRKNLTDRELQEPERGAVAPAPMPPQNDATGSWVRKSGASSLYPTPDARPAAASPASGIDFFQVRAFMKTGVNATGIEVEAPHGGQGAVFYTDIQVWGTSQTSVTLTARAILDGGTYCTISGSVDPGYAYYGQCSTPWIATAGPHTLQWNLDHANAVSELNEANNSSSKSFTSSNATYDLVARRSYMRTATAGGGIEVLDQPNVGETVYFHSNWQFTGTGASTSISYRAVLDGSPFCSNTVPTTPSTSTITTSCPSG
jgi:hypothetical protein